MDSAKVKYIKNYFGLKDYKKYPKNIDVFCPFHDDTNPSGSLNISKGLYHCHSKACIGGLNFDQLYDKLLELKKEKLDEDKLKESITKKIVNKDLDLGDVKTKGLAYIKHRGINPDNIPINFEIVDDKEKWANYYGYIIFESVNETFVSRNITKHGPKSILPPGPKEDLFWLSRDESLKVIVLVEGIFDGLTLHELGFKNIIVNNASTWPNKESIRKKWAYSFRGYTVLICFDNDVAGFEGARDIKNILMEFDVDTFILELPHKLGNDLNDAWVNNKSKLIRWASVVRNRFFPNDVYYVQDLYRGDVIAPLNVLPTGIEALDRKLTGGFKDGNHIISGNTGVGKTSLVKYLGICAVNEGKRVLCNSCEISKKQSWARLACNYSNYTWEELEENPHLLEEEAYEKTVELAKNFTVVNGWPLNRIIQESSDYDVIIIDYIQRVREVYGSDESATRALINNYTSQLSDLGVLNGKIILTVSALSRDSYDDPRKFGLKESGNLEYTGTTVSRLAPVGGNANRKSFHWIIQKNNRGDTGVVTISNVDLGHIDFSNAVGKDINEI